MKPHWEVGAAPWPQGPTKAFYPRVSRNIVICEVLSATALEQYCSLP